MYEWEEEFETEFKVNKSKKDNLELNLIVGQAPYKQKLNGNQFKVSCNEYPYSDIDKTVGFLVTNWIKVQDSLEMIFNLLFGSDNSLSVLAHLRKNKISASEFALYLYKNYNIILVNAYEEWNGSEKHSILNNNKIKALIKSKKYTKVNICTVGKKASKVIRSLKLNNVNTLELIHSSGVNLNTDNEQYYKDWYDMDDTMYKKFKLL